MKINLKDSEPLIEQLNDYILSECHYRVCNEFTHYVGVGEGRISWQKAVMAIATRGLTIAEFPGVNRINREGLYDYINEIML